MWIYRQATGELERNGALTGIGYSGHADGVNNSELEAVHDVGPIPRGNYTMELILGADGQPAAYEGKAAPVLQLTPKEGTQVFGRSGFLMHGDLIEFPGQDLASHGCIIMPHYVRQQVAASEDKDLQVIT